MVEFLHRWAVRLRAANTYVVDGVLALIVAVPLAVPFVVDTTSQITPLGIALNVATVVPLIWRRRWPALVALLIFVSASLVSVVHRPGQTLQYAGLVAIYTIADRGRPWQRRTFLAIIALTFPVASVLITHSSAADFMFTVGLPLAAYLVGTLARTSRAQRDALAERNIGLLRSRDLDAARARAQERNRIARDMHDILAHAVTVMVVQAEAGPVVVRSDPDRAERAFEAIADAGRAAMAQLSRVLGVLNDDQDCGIRPPQPTTAEIPQLIDDARRSGVAVEIHTTGERLRLAADAELAAYRLVQEALTNTVKHTTGASATVHLDWRDGLTVTVTDRGGRLPVQRPPHSGYGLIGIRERILACGGTLDTGPTTSGFEVRARLPLAVTA